MSHLYSTKFHEKFQNNKTRMISCLLLIFVLFSLSSSVSAEETLNLYNGNSSFNTQNRNSIIFTGNTNYKHEKTIINNFKEFSDKINIHQQIQNKNKKIKNKRQYSVNSIHLQNQNKNKQSVSPTLNTKTLSFNNQRNTLTIEKSLFNNNIDKKINDSWLFLSKLFFSKFKNINIKFSDILSLFLAFSSINITIYFIWSSILVMFPLKKIKTENKGIEKYKLYIMVPSLNEKYVLENTIHKFFKNEKSSRLFESYLVVIDDGSDDGTTDILKKIVSQYENLHIILRTLPNARQGKGKALNEGLRYIKNLERSKSEKIIVGVLDADAYIKDEEYNKVVSVFNKYNNLSMIQTCVGMNATNGWLHRMQDIEFQSCICLISNIRNYLGNAAGGGNGQFFRLSSIKNKKEVWGNSLLEDFELSTRLLLEGKRTLFLESVVVFQEPVSKFKAFIVQRTRWAQGGIECIPKYGKQILKSHNIKKRAKFEMFFYMLLPFITSIGVIGHLVSCSYSFWMFFMWQAPISLDLIIMIIVSFGISLIFGAIYGNRTEYGVFKGILISLTIPIYGILLVPVCYRAIIRFVLGKRKWEKTEHSITSV